MCKSAMAEDQSCPALMLKDLTPLSRWCQNSSAHPALFDDFTDKKAMHTKMIYLVI
jgi:hypothetical protein